MSLRVIVNVLHFYTKMVTGSLILLRSMLILLLSNLKIKCKTRRTDLFV